MTKQEQIDRWSKRYGRQLSEEEHREICDNLSGFFKILHGWDKAEREKKGSADKKI
ncbi:MAG: hypothetical protein WC732_08115 [Candidatus Omnitrophota bacterium]